ncbi:MAG: glycosyltransferase family 2 protein [Betaproteobacteria bacterium]|nr:glycosyltransferase family 2 protein [Betaproteobacteria bacterium]
MGALWCRDLPTVTVPRTRTPKAVTIVLPYYDNPVFLAAQIAHWQTFSADVRAHLSAVIVDDGSPTPARLPADRPFPMRLFRIEVDVRWNWLAARNIGAHYAADGWLLLTDMDHRVPHGTAQGLVYGQHDPTGVYAFSRREHTGDAITPHSASFLMTRALFWRIGGYDETLSGHYGTDGEYRRRLAQHAQMRLLTEELVRFEYVADASTTRYLRKQPEDAGVKALIARRRPGWTPKTLSFPYHEVTAS